MLEIIFASWLLAAGLIVVVIVGLFVLMKVEERSINGHLPDDIPPQWHRTLYQIRNAREVKRGRIHR